MSISTEGGYLLDTNVVSETRKLRPDARVGAFLDSLEAEQMFVSVITLGELRKGAAMRARSDREAADELSRWIERLGESFSARIVSIDTEIADRWGRLGAARARPVIDTLLAATAIVHNLTLATRNTRDVADTGARIVNPWE